MKFPSRQATTRRPGAAGTARVDRRIPALLRRVRPGDVVVLDHLDLDRETAQSLLDHGVSAVVNAAPSISGRYPNLGPELLARAGVVQLDSVGPEVFSQVKDGARVRIEGADLLLDDRVVATGRALVLPDVVDLMDLARSGLATQLQSFTHNTTEFLRREQALLLHGQGVPDLTTRIAGRPVVVVVRDFDHERDLRRMRRFIHERKPVLIGVDAGADALLAVKLVPDIVVVGEAGLGRASGAVERLEVSDRALSRAREVVVHADASDRVVGAERVDRLGIRARRICAGGSTEDIALLMADARGASLIVTVGTHATLDEFLDRQRTGMSSAFLTRLRVGPKLVDAKSVPVMYAGRVRLWQLLLVLLVGLLALAAAIAATPTGGTWFDHLAEAWPDLVDRLRELVT